MKRETNNKKRSLSLGQFFAVMFGGFAESLYFCWRNSDMIAMQQGNSFFYGFYYYFYLSH